MTVIVFIATVAFGTVVAARPLSNLLWTAQGNQTGAWFGNSVASAGDVNGDGYDDVLIAARQFDSPLTDEGLVLLYHGSASGVSAAPSWSAESNQASAFFGSSVASAGDINGDGYDDVIVGAFGYDNGESDEGRVFIYLGSLAGLSTSPAWTAESNKPGAFFGFSVASAGDVNHDGYSDVIIGAYQYNNGLTNEGAAFVYLGSAGGLGSSGTPLNADWTAEGEQSGANLGICVAGAGDVKADGFSDIIVGAYAYDNGQSNEGRVMVWHGSPSGLGINGTPTNADWFVESDQPNARLGFSAATADDVNGDGYSDVVVGAYLYDHGETNEGAAFAYFGSASGLNGGVNGSPANASWLAEGNEVEAQFGNSVASAGDVNGDGYSEVIVGTGDLGEACAYRGSAAGLNAGYFWSIGTQSVLNTVATAGDVNGDGNSDVVGGAWFYDSGQTDEGRASVFLGVGLGPAGFESYDFITYPPEMWGGDSPPGTPGEILELNFFAVYAATFGVAEVGIHGAAGFSMQFSNPNAVSNYLPPTGPPGPLISDYGNPTDTSSGTFGGEALALRINIDFSDAGYLRGNAGIPFGDLVVVDLDNMPLLNGLTIRQVMDLNNTALGGGAAPYSFMQLEELTRHLNVSFIGGNMPAFTIEHLRFASCMGDINGNGDVNIDDLLAVISHWGPCAYPSACPADIAPIHGNDVVDIDDLLTVIIDWNRCR